MATPLRPTPTTRATLNDVAVRAGVSKSTASMVLNNHPQAKRYSETTRERVLACAQALGYRPNFMARQLRSAQNKWILLYISSFREMFAAQVADAFEVQAAKRGYTLVVATFKTRDGAATFKQEGLSAHGVQAVAVVGQSTEQALSNDAVAQLADEGTHCCLVNRDLNHPRVSRVVIDNEPGQREVAEHLYSQGVRNVLMLPGPADWILGTQRRAAFERCMRDLGPTDTEVSHTDATRWQNGYSAATERLKQPGKPPHAIVCATDYLAYGALKACAEAGLHVGRDIAVVGFDDIFPSEFTMPSLTTVRLPMEQMGRTSADLLIDSLEGKAELGRRVVLSTGAIFRSSGRVDSARLGGSPA